MSSRRDDHTVLVHCSARASRSPAVATTALALSEGIGLDEAFRRARACRDAVDPHDAPVRRAVSVYVDRRDGA